MGNLDFQTCSSETVFTDHCSLMSCGEVQVPVKLLEFVFVVFHSSAHDLP